MKVLEQGTKVRWKLGEQDVTGTVVAGPYQWDKKERAARAKIELDTGPYHNVRCNEVGGYHQVITLHMTVIEDA